ncbi:MAG: ABC transporter substrate-binding protein [Dehalococcoidia bacterium]
MKRFLFVPVVVVLVSILVFGGCAKTETTESPSATEPTQTTEPTPSGPTYGGILKATRASSPACIGYQPDFSPVDTIYASPIAERLVSWDEEGNYIPVLAKSWEGDPENNTLTWHLREGVKFQDGTPFNAEAVKFRLCYRLGLLT